MAKTIGVDQVGDVIESLMKQFMKEFSAEAGERTVDKAPAITGTLKGSIRLFENSPRTELGTPDKSGSSSKAKIQSAADNISGDKDVFITAGTNYAGSVEYGTNDGRPDAYIRRTVNEAQAIANEAAKKVDI